MLKAAIVLAATLPLPAEYAPADLRPGDLVYVIPEFGGPRVRECRVAAAGPNMRPSGPRRDVVLSFEAIDGPAWDSVPAAGLYRTRGAASRELAARLRAEGALLRRLADDVEYGWSRP